MPSLVVPMLTYSSQNDRSRRSNVNLEITPRSETDSTAYASSYISEITPPKPPKPPKSVLSELTAKAVKIEQTWDTICYIVFNIAGEYVNHIEIQPKTASDAKEQSEKVLKGILTSVEEGFSTTATEGGKVLLVSNNKLAIGMIFANKANLEPAEEKTRADIVAAVKASFDNHRGRVIRADYHIVEIDVEEKPKDPKMALLLELTEDRKLSVNSKTWYNKGWRDGLQDSDSTSSRSRSQESDSTSSGSESMDSIPNNPIPIDQWVDGVAKGVASTH